MIIFSLNQTPFEHKRFYVDFLLTGRLVSSSLTDYLQINLKGVKGLRGGKLVLGASLLALSMYPEEATHTQDNVGKVSA